MENKYIVGLDIGTTKIACFIGERAESGKVRIVGFGKTESVGVERGVVKNIDLTADSIRQAVREASDQAKYDVSEVYVGIAGQHIKGHTNQGSIMIPEDHRKIMSEDLERLIDDQYRTSLDPGEEIIHVFPQSYEVDNEPLSIEISPVGVPGQRLAANFHIVTGNANNIMNIRYAVESAGLKIKGVVLEPIASALAVLDETDKTAGVALVDIGGGTTDIAIFHESIIRHTSVIPLAGEAITSDIRNNCQILKNQAENLKVKFGSCVPANVRQDDVISIPGIRGQAPREISMKTLASIIKARMQVILEQVQYEISVSGYDRQLIAGVVFTGGGARMQHVGDLAQLIIGLDNRIGTPDEHLEHEGSVSFEDLSHPKYATGIGLVIYGLQEQEREARRAGHAANDDTAVQNTPEESPKVDEPAEAPAPKPKRERKNFGKAIGDWLTNKLTDGVDDDDDAL